MSDGVSSNRDPRPGSPGSAASSVSVLRLVLSPRWIGWHVLTLGAMATCGFLAAWQWSRAGSALGSAVNVGYGLQWPVFAVFFAWIWWRMLRIEIIKLRAAPEPAAAPAPASVGPGPAASAEPSPFAYRARRAGPVDEAKSPALAEYNRMLAALAEHDREKQQQEGR